MSGHRLQRVADYYDDNTHRFLRFGRSRKAASIHRRLWAPGVETPDQALRHINQRIAGWVRPTMEAGSGLEVVLDLGCGVGGTAIDLARQLGTRVIGMTVSLVQAREATARARDLDQQGRCGFAVADFHRLPLARAACAAYAVESFAHALDPGRFFAEARACLAPGGRLIVVDDFLADVETAAQRAWPWRREQWARRFAEGWRLESLMSSRQAAQLGAAAGLSLILQEDLTGWIRLPPAWVLWLLRLVAAVRLPGSYWGSLAGGAALQVCEQQGWVRYQALVFSAPA